MLLVDISFGRLLGKGRLLLNNINTTRVQLPPALEYNFTTSRLLLHPESKILLLEKGDYSRTILIQPESSFPRDLNITLIQPDYYYIRSLKYYYNRRKLIENMNSWDRDPKIPLIQPDYYYIRPLIHPDSTVVD